MKPIHKNAKIIPRSCTKHGVYTGPYCPECYEKAMGSDEPSVLDQESQSD
jgi:hypothetical protein